MIRVGISTQADAVPSPWCSPLLLPDTSASRPPAPRVPLSTELRHASEPPSFSSGAAFALSRLAHEQVYNLLLLKVFKTPDLLSTIKLHLSPL